MPPPITLHFGIVCDVILYTSDVACFWVLFIFVQCVPSLFLLCFFLPLFFYCWVLLSALGWFFEIDLREKSITKLTPPTTHGHWRGNLPSNYYYSSSHLRRLTVTASYLWSQRNWGIRILLWQLKQEDVLGSLTKTYIFYFVRVFDCDHVSELHCGLPAGSAGLRFAIDESYWRP